MRRAVRGTSTVPSGPTAEIRPPEVTTVIAACGTRPVPSMTVTCSKANGSIASAADVGMRLPGAEATSMRIGIESKRIRWFLSGVNSHSSRYRQLIQTMTIIARAPINR